MVHDYWYHHRGQIEIHLSISRHCFYVFVKKNFFFVLTTLCWKSSCFFCPKYKPTQLLFTSFAYINLQNKILFHHFHHFPFFSLAFYYINPKVQQFTSAANSRAICSIRGLWGNCGRLETGSISAQMRKSADNIRATMEFFDYIFFVCVTLWPFLCYKWAWEHFGLSYRICVYFLWVLSITHDENPFKHPNRKEEAYSTQERIYSFFGCILIWMAKKKKKIFDDEEEEAAAVVAEAMFSET